MHTRVSGIKSSSWSTPAGLEGLGLRVVRRRLEGFRALGLGFRGSLYLWFETSDSGIYSLWEAIQKECPHGPCGQLRLRDPILPAMQALVTSKRCFGRLDRFSRRWLFVPLLLMYGIACFISLRPQSAYGWASHYFRNAANHRLHTCY